MRVHDLLRKIDAFLQGLPFEGKDAEKKRLACGRRLFRLVIEARQKDFQAEGGAENER